MQRKNMMVENVKDEDGHVVFAIRLGWDPVPGWEEASEEVRAKTRQTHWCDFEIFECNVWQPDWTPLFGQTPDIAPDLDAVQPTIVGHVKWDGCSEFRSADGHGLHTCDTAGLKRLLDAVLEARRLASLVVMEEV